MGNSNCSLGLQYSTKPPSSAETTQSNLSLYCVHVSDSCSLRGNKRNKRTVIKWTGNRWSVSTVSNGLSSPRPSYSRMVPEFCSELTGHEQTTSTGKKDGANTARILCAWPLRCTQQQDFGVNPSLTILIISEWCVCVRVCMGGELEHTDDRRRGPPTHRS